VALSQRGNIRPVSGDLFWHRVMWQIMVAERRESVALIPASAPGRACFYSPRIAEPSSTAVGLRVLG
jgi:hypothetical protein